MSITPDLASHKNLETDVSEYLTSKGYWIGDSTYHRVLPSDIKELLSTRYNPTALYLRGRADRIAIHKTHEAVFEWEAKTHTSKTRHDMTIEALPLCHHIAQASLGVQCLYAYRDGDLYDCGFWVHEWEQLDIRVIIIPGRWGREKADWFKVTFQAFFPKVSVCQTGGTNGSGDPFAVVSQQCVSQLPTWKQLIDDIQV